MTRDRRGDFDMDLYRDADLAFGPRSFRDGGLLPFEGRTYLSQANGLPATVFDAREDGWLTPDTPILVRGSVRILPLAWRGDPQAGYNAYADPTQMTKFAFNVQSTGMYWSGPWRTLAELDEHHGNSIRSYVDALSAGGATQVSSWTYSGTVGLALVRAGVDDEGTGSLALHIVPVSWVSERHATGPVQHIDVRWSWAEVIDLHTARAARERSDAGPQAS